MNEAASEHLRLPDLIESRDIRGAIFDMDGVLADTESLHLRSWFELLRRHSDQPAPEELLRRTFGQTNDRIIPQLLGPEVDVPALSDEKEVIYRELAAAELVPTPGVESVLEALRARSIGTAIGTSGPPENVAFLIDRFGWQHLFDALVDRSRFAESKPAPDCFLTAALELGVEPERCVVFEDSLYGLEAARRAGMVSIGVVGTEPPDVLAREATYVVRDFRLLLAENGKKGASP